MNKIIYQIALRSFTPEGTFGAATKLLEYVSSLGVDVVYVCPFFKEDTSPENQSRRQLESKTDNPKIHTEYPIILLLMKSMALLKM